MRFFYGKPDPNGNKPNIVRTAMTFWYSEWQTNDPPHRRHRIHRWAVVACLILLHPLQADPDEGFLPRHFPQLFDPEDGNLDLSQILDEPQGFFPLVTPITEPAVGYGAAVVPIFIDLPEEKGRRPDIWATGALATANGSRGYFGGYSGYLDDDRWHIFGGGGNFSINLDFHGLGNVSTGTPLRYNLDTVGGLIGADRRIGDSAWRVGLRYLYGEIDPSLVLSGDAGRLSAPDFISRFGPFDFSSTVSSLQLAVIRDTRDNIFTPTRGSYMEIDLTANLPAIGASHEYYLLAWTGIRYRPLHDERLFLGWRGDFVQSFGDVPFYRRPAISMRGVPAQRFQGAGIASTEAELRWQFHPRWSVLGFAGVGATWSKDRPFDMVRATASGGVGFRYLIARRHRLHTGIDLAVGEDGPAIYVQFGSGWFRP
ncbi:BamA/TamA family outer membrane protein [Haloferula rosea]|uniref:BamA/TamA family outer membrane protein n=1 Tax=Haloferula rosea TaxID=490093 RepID=A0A934VAJ6_9BACT|nr:BamA/TamA family outer membrane protein [Haloferula rosea]MBK1826368.1 BamA/TamA family outer membrane protein [Haloferula rosea]